MSEWREAGRLINRLRKKGLRFQVDDRGLWVEPKERRSQSDNDAIRLHRERIITWIENPVVAMMAMRDEEMEGESAELKLLLFDNEQPSFNSFAVTQRWIDAMRFHRELRLAEHCADKDDKKQAKKSKPSKKKGSSPSGSFGFIVSATEQGT